MFITDQCGVCGCAGESPCGSCVRLLPPAPRLTTPEGLDELFALFAYEDSGRTLMTNLKYRNRRGALAWMARALAGPLLTQRAEMVSWVPGSQKGREHRGFDTGEVLARAIARELRVPVRPLLERRDGFRQSARTRAEREAGPVLKPKAATMRLRVSSVILVDDICTTGSSLSAGAQALRTCGIRYVIGAVGARTPMQSAA